MQTIYLDFPKFPRKLPDFSAKPRKHEQKNQSPRKKNNFLHSEKSPKVTQTPDLWEQRQARYSRPSGNEGRCSYCTKIKQVEKIDKKVVYGKKSSFFYKTLARARLKKYRGAQHKPR